MKQMAIEEKLEKLGVERGSGSNVPHIYAPHARAASVCLFTPAHPLRFMVRSRYLRPRTLLFFSSSSTNSSNHKTRRPIIL